MNVVLRSAFIVFLVFGDTVFLLLCSRMFVISFWISILAYLSCVASFSVSMSLYTSCYFSCCFCPRLIHEGQTWVLFSFLVSLGTWFVCYHLVNFGGNSMN